MAVTEQTPQYLVPQMGTMPVSSSRHYQTATITGVLGAKGATTEIDAPLTVPEPASVAAGQPALGVLLTHEQQWVLAGTALGPLLHSVCLAPGEITQIAVRSQSRQVVERSVDRGIQLEDTSSSGSSSTTTDEGQRTQATSAAAGMSVATSASATVEAATGGLAGLIGVSAGGSTTLANSNQAATSTGSRAVADEANQSVHQLARDQAQLARTRSTAAVREVAESDSVEINTRVIANYNHMHALTMQYFEVEQVYQLRTRVTDAERLLFVPMQVINFSDVAQASAAIDRYRSELMAVAADLGLHHVVAKLAADRMTAPDPVLPGDGGDTAVERTVTLAKELDTAIQTRATRQTEVDDTTDAVAGARDELRAAREGKLVERSRAQRKLQQAMAAARAAQDNLAAADDAVAAADAALLAARWEADQRRLAAGLDDEDVREALDGHRLAVNQGLWLRLDPSITAGFLQRRTHAGEALGNTVDPTPVAVSGHLLGFRWRFRNQADEQAFVALHTSESELEHSVSVPTGGLFGEAVLGTSIGAERIDLTRFWNWKDALPPIRPAQIAAQEVAPPTTLAAPSPAKIQESQLSPGPVEFLETSPTLPAVAALLANPELFRDMSGRETTAALATSAMELSADGASAAATLANENFERFLKFQHTVASTVLEAAQRPKVEPTMAGGALNAKKAAGDEATPAEDEPTVDANSGEGDAEEEDAAAAPGGAAPVAAGGAVAAATPVVAGAAPALDVEFEANEP